jgi:hypothetical protein
MNHLPEILLSADLPAKLIGNAEYMQRRMRIGELCKRFSNCTP